MISDIFTVAVPPFRAGWQQTEWQMLPVNPALPPAEGKKEEKGERLTNWK